MSADRFDLFISAITQISKDIQKIKNREMLSFGLRGSHVMCLFYLKQNKEGLTAAELSALCEVDKGAVSRTIAELDKQGYVVIPEETEKRKYRAKITLSGLGKQLTDQIEVIIDKVVEEASNGLSEAERASFSQSLFLISENLRKLASS